ncbi:MAG: hypothetical protein KGJ59_07510 [Bacteroidota bacterium]|nr:hypothetical protein [Bacteroidota bacterium]
MKKTWIARRIAGGIVIAVAAFFAFGFIAMLLWNALIPDLFHGPVVTFWQAVGIVVLSHILLRGWGPWHRGYHWRHDRWKHRLEEKLSAMTPEEREKFKEEWRRRCGWSPEGSGEKPA